MGNKQYENALCDLLNDGSICKENRALFKEFFEWEERKLKRKRRLRELDKGCYLTLNTTIVRVRNVNKFFNNKPWKDLTREDIKKVYDDLEEGTIKNKQGKPFKDLSSFYNKVIKSKPFQMAGKADLAREVIEFSGGKEEQVRFFEEVAFKDMAAVLNKPRHKLLFWLAWDIGENINSLLQLKKLDFKLQKNPDNKEEEYLVNLRREILKRSRKARGEITNFRETVQFGKMVLSKLKDNDLVFPMKYTAAKMLLNRVVEKTGAKCTPRGEPINWKDFRSSMACHLLKSGWTSDEINGRLGHKPSSRVLDKYLDHLAMNRHEPKKRLYDNDLELLKEELEAVKRREKLTAMRSEELKKRFDRQEKALVVLMKMVKKKQ